jgi:pyruvate formate lyase activating enzyme
MTASELPPIKGFMETSFLDWPGQVCSVLFLPYCNLRCPYCHNHQLILKPDALETFSLESVLQRLTPLRDWIEGFCITGGEPTIHRSLPSLLENIRESGFKTKLDTNGTQPEILEHLISEHLLDHVAMDLKAPLNDAAYEHCAGVFVPAEIITKSIEVLARSGMSSTFRCTVTPTLLGEEDVCLLAENLRDILSRHFAGPGASPGLILQNFNPADPLEAELRAVKPFPPEILARMQAEVDRILG